MVFSDLFFIFAFIPSFALLYILASLIDKKMKTSPDTPYNRTKNWVLVLFSLLFYAWGEPVWVILLLFSAYLNWFMALKIAQHKETPKAQLFAGIAIGVDILLLVIFKYTGFLVENINGLLHIGIPVPHIVMPIGISFFTSG